MFPLLILYGYAPTSWNQTGAPPVQAKQTQLICSLEYYTK